MTKVVAVWLIWWLLGVWWAFALGMSIGVDDFFVAPGVAVAGLLFTVANVGTFVYWLRTGSET